MTIKNAITVTLDSLGLQLKLYNLTEKNPDLQDLPNFMLPVEEIGTYDSQCAEQICVQVIKMSNYFRPHNDTLPATCYHIIDAVDSNLRLGSSAVVFGKRLTLRDHTENGVVFSGIDDSAVAKKAQQVKGVVALHLLKNIYKTKALKTVVVFEDDEPIPSSESKLSIAVAMGGGVQFTTYDATVHPTLAASAQHAGIVAVGGRRNDGRAEYSYVLNHPAIYLHDHFDPEYLNQLVCQRLNDLFSAFGVLSDNDYGAKIISTYVPPTA